MKPIPLFERFPTLAAKVPWTPIVAGPTPIEPLSMPSRQLMRASLSVKREDLSHAILGGNKVRGLEFLLGDAVRRKVDSLITFGAAGSNHVAATAFHARALGIDTTALLISQPWAAYVARNLHDGVNAGARLVPVNALTAGPRLIYEWLRLKQAGRRVRIVPPGGTTPMSCLGHVNAALELRAQIDAGLIPRPDYLVVGLGSLGTAAGLLLGCRLAGLATRIISVVVFHRWFCTAGRCTALARRTLRFMQTLDPAVPDIAIQTNDFEVISSALGGGYAHATREATELSLQLCAAGPSLDQTYTGKTLAGALDWIETNKLQGIVVYWHTYHHRPALTVDETKALEAKLPHKLHKYLRQP